MMVFGLGLKNSEKISLLLGGINGRLGYTSDNPTNSKKGEDEK